MEKKFLIIRHAEAEKTLKAIHGGSGTPLTQQGKADLQKLINFLLKDFPDLEKATLVCSSLVPQVLETAEFISKESNLPLLKFENLRNMNMGVLAGLSDAEAKEKYPDVMKRLELWRSKLLDEKELNIPEKEPLDKFLTRIKSVLTECFLSDKKNIIIIVTRSIGIGILNLLLAQSELKEKPYTRFRFDPCSITIIESESLGFGKIISINQTFFLERKIDYPDD